MCPEGLVCPRGLLCVNGESPMFFALEGVLHTVLSALYITHGCQCCILMLHPVNLLFFRCGGCEGLQVFRNCVTVGSTGTQIPRGFLCVRSRRAYGV